MPSPAGAATVNEKSDAPGDARMKAGNAPKKSSELAKESRRDLKDRETNLRNVNGKNFRRANNIWTDTAYKGESTKNISRGSDKYKKLDSGLRSIAENLGGTVIVVWKDKAYKIQ